MDQEVLRGELGFTGAVFSDDLPMAGAVARGTVTDRAASALEAGCDFALVCNDNRDGPGFGLASSGSAPRTSTRGSLA